MKFSILLLCLLSCKKPIYFSAISADTLEQSPKSIELNKELYWLNTKEQIDLNSLRDKIVLICFLRFTNMNSINILREISVLQNKFKKELIILGIHSPKFAAEKEIEFLRQEIILNEVEFPVANDINLTAWNDYEIDSWPSFVLISPNSRIIGKISGEKVFLTLEESIINQIKYFKINQEEIIKTKLEKANIPDRLLSYPSKAILNQKGNEIFISDTNHNRILRIDLDTREILDVVGGIPGFEDGILAEAKFNSPKGIFLKDNYLYVADTLNHSIRRIDFNSKKVITILGNGKRVDGLVTSGKGREVSLNSPIDLTIIKDKLYYTMAGSNQIWVLDLTSLETEKFSGSGRDNIQDGNENEATFSMPYGITSDNLKLYITDSNSSGLRQIDIETKKVKTLIGTGLFEHGDTDGKIEAAKLQFPNFLQHSSFKIFFADSLNHKLKVYDLNTKEVSTVSGSGKFGNFNSDFSTSEFFLPSSIYVHKTSAYVTDKFNHQVKILDLTKLQVTNFNFKVSEKLFQTPKDKNKIFEEKISVEEIKLHPSTNEIKLKFDIESGFHFLENAPYYFYPFSKDPNSVKVLNQTNEISKKISSMKSLSLKLNGEKGEIYINQILFYKEVKKDSEILIKKFTLEIPFITSEQGIKNPSLNIKVKGIE